MLGSQLPTATRPHARLVLALSRGQRTMHFFHLVPPESLRDKYLALGANFIVVFAISVAVVAGWINLLGTILPLGSAPTTIAELVMQLNLALAAFGIAVVTCRSAYDSVRFGRRRVVVNAQSQTHKQMVWYVYIILFVRGRTLDTRDPPTPRAAASRPPLLISDKRLCPDFITPSQVALLALVTGVILFAQGKLTDGAEWAMFHFYHALGFVRLEQVGLILGGIAFLILTTLGGGGALAFNCFGRAHVIQHVLRSVRTPPPVIDLIQHRSRSAIVGPLLILLPSALVTGYVLGLSVLMPPTRVFFAQSPNPPTHLQPLCVPAATGALYHAYIGALQSTGSLAGDQSTADSPRASLATPLLTFHRLWDAHFPALETSCVPAVMAHRGDGTAEGANATAEEAAAALFPIAAIAVPLGAATFPLPPLIMSLRDMHGLAAPPADCTAASTSECARVLLTARVDVEPEGCTANAMLVAPPPPSAEPPSMPPPPAEGTVLMNASATRGATTRQSVASPQSLGIVTYDGLELTAASPLCTGTYILHLTATSGAGGAHEATAERRVAVEAVAIDESRGSAMNLSLPLPEVENEQVGERTYGMLYYAEAANMTHVVTTTITNQTTVRNATTSRPRTEIRYDEVTRVRETTHMLSFLVPPPPTIRLHTPFNVTLSLMTETGLPIPAQMVQALLLASAAPAADGSAAARPPRLRSGSFGYTDAEGVVTLSVCFESGAGGSHFLTFGSSGTMHADLRQRFGPEVESILLTQQLWGMVLKPIGNELAGSLTMLRGGVLRDHLERSVERTVRRVLDEHFSQVRDCIDQREYARETVLNSTNTSVDVTTRINADGSIEYGYGLRDDNSGEVTRMNESELQAAGIAALPPCYANLYNLVDSHTNEDAQRRLAGALATAVFESVLEALGLTSLFNALVALLPQLQAYEDEGRAPGMMRSAERVRRLLQEARSAYTGARNATTPTAQTMQSLLLLTLGAGTPPPVLINVERAVATAELTAPLVGYGVVPTRAISFASLWQTVRTSRGLCMRDRSLLFLPPQQAGRGATPLTAPLWQAPLFLQLNWLVDTDMFTTPFDPTIPPLCRKSWIAPGQPLPGTAPIHATGSDGPFDASEVSADGWPDGADAFEAGAEWLEGLGGDTAAFGRACADVNTDADMDATAIASGCALGRALGIGNSSAPVPQWLSARPRVLVRDASGLPVAGAHCTVREAGRGAPAMEVEALTISYTCGPSDENGVMHVSNLSITGGSSRELYLEVAVEGLVASLDANRSQWGAAAAARADSRTVLELINPDVPALTPAHIGTFFLMSHGSLHLLALLALPLFAINRVDAHGKRVRFRWKILAALCLLLYTSIVASLLERYLRVGDGASTSMMAIGVNDVVAVRTTPEGSRVNYQGVLAIATCAITTCVAALVTVLLLEDAPAILSAIGARLPTRTRRMLGIRRRVKVPALKVEAAQIPPRAASAKRLARQQSSNEIFTLTAIDAAAQDARTARLRWWQQLFEPMYLRRDRHARAHVRLLVAPRSKLRELVCERDAQSFRAAMRRRLGATWHTICCCCYSTRWRTCCRRLPPTRVGGGDDGSSGGELTRAAIIALLDAGPFHYPQRLYMAITLGGWMQILLTFIMVRLFEHLEYMCRASQHMSATLGAQGVHSPDLSAVIHFGPTFRLVLVSLWELAGTRARHLTTTVATMSIALPILQYTLITINTLDTLRRYRQRALNMRRGDYFFTRGLYEQHYSNRFVGFRVAGDTLYILIICGVFGVAIGMPAMFTVLVLLDWLQENPMIETVDPVTNEVVSVPANDYVQQQGAETLQMLIRAILGLLAAWVVQYICGTYVFYTHQKRLRWLRFRYVYALYDYNLMFFNCALGLGMFVFRIFSWFIVGMLSINRLDMCLLPSPSGLEKSDNPWHTYVALILQDHQYNCPVNHVFFQILTHELTRSRQNRARRKMRINFVLIAHTLRDMRAMTSSVHGGSKTRRHGVAPAALSVQQADGEGVGDDGASGAVEAAASPAAPSTLDRTRTLALGGANLLHEVEQRLAKMVHTQTNPVAQRRIQVLRARQEAAHRAYLTRRRVLARWSLALMLLRNPFLRPLRVHDPPEEKGKRTAVANVMRPRRTRVAPHAEVVKRADSEAMAVAVGRQADAEDKLLRGDESPAVAVGRQADAEDKFLLADTSGDGYVDEEELLVLVRDILTGTNGGLPTDAKLRAFLQTFRTEADTPLNLGFDEFVRVYNAIGEAMRVGKLVASLSE